MTPRILLLVPTDYGELLKKGVAFMLAEKEENGFFERVVTVHPTANRNQVVDLSPVHRLYEFKEYFLPFGSRFKLIRYFHHLFHVVRLTLNIVRIIDKEDLHLIRANDPHFTGFLAWLVHLIRPIPFCLSLHADYDKQYELDPKNAPTLLGSRSLARALEKFLMKRANKVLPIRHYLANKVKAYGVSDEKICVIPHGIDLTPFQTISSLRSREKLFLPNDRSLLSFAGRLSKENYVMDILRLAVELRKKRSNFLIVMAGDGQEKPALERFINDNQLLDCVKMVGPQSRETVIGLRYDSKVCLCLMGGLSLIEACAAGRPVIAYDVEWHSELIKNGVTGFLVPEHDIQRLTEDVEQLLDHPLKAQEMGSQAKALAFKQHDIVNTSKVKQACYQELLALAPSKS